MDSEITKESVDRILRNLRCMRDHQNPTDSQKAHIADAVAALELVEA